MIAICKDKKEINFSVDEVYLIFGGEYYTNEETGQRYIRELLTQDDDGGLVFVSANSFFIPDVNFEKYILKADKFFWKCIGYDGFLFYYHDDNSERIRDYKKAKADFFTAKMELYDELTAETINRKLQNTSCLEQDFIFDYLRLRKIDDYIEWSIDNIRNAMIDNWKWYDVYKCFEYLSSFESETVKQFFSEYLIKDHWKNDKINNMIYIHPKHLPDSMSCEALRDKFNAFIARYKDNTNKYDLYNVLDELYELSDRQWHTYELLENNVKQQIENFIFSILDIENTVIMDSVLSIIPLLGLTNLFLYITEKKEFIANKEVKKLIDDAEKEYGVSVENPYSGM